MHTPPPPLLLMMLDRAASLASSLSCRYSLIQSKGRLTSKTPRWHRDSATPWLHKTHAPRDSCIQNALIHAIHDNHSVVRDAHSSSSVSKCCDCICWCIICCRGVMGPAKLLGVIGCIPLRGVMGCE